MADTLALRCAQGAITLMQARAALTALVPATRILLDAIEYPLAESDLPAIAVRLTDDSILEWETIGRVEEAVGIELRIFCAGTSADPIAAVEAIRAEVYAALMGEPTLGGACAVIDYRGTNREYDAAERRYTTATITFAARTVRGRTDLTA